jgi:hypothetical protein
MPVVSQVTGADKYFNTLTPIQRQDDISGSLLSLKRVMKFLRGVFVLSHDW